MVTARRALICGISGQDGTYLAQLLHKKGYEVWGTSRNPLECEFNGLKALKLFDKVRIISMTIEEYQSVINVFTKVNPDEVYNLAGQTSVGLSFEKAQETFSSIAVGTLNLLEAIRSLNKKNIRFFSAGSGECFGDTGLNAVDESTVFRPQSPYAVAKAAAAWHVTVYRESYDLFACTGILFNHESPIRQKNFVTTKIISTVRRIQAGSDEKLKLGNIEIRRDWGWAPEYVDAMWRMLNTDKPNDFVIATGISQSLSEFVQIVFEEAGLDWRNHVIIDSNLLRPSDPKVSLGNPSKAINMLDWKPKFVGSDIPKKMFLENMHN